MSSPQQNDRVYRVLEQIFSSNAGHVLTRDMQEEKEEVKELAWKRFQLGYPPRKDKDISCGDAINWEWLIKVSKSLKGKIYIVFYLKCIDRKPRPNCLISSLNPTDFGEIGGFSI